MKILFILVLAQLCFSQIDNPDAPNLILDFEMREKSYLEKIDKAVTTKEMMDSQLGYGTFLDIELNNVYQRLRKKLSDEQMKLLRIAQKQWLTFRDAEMTYLFKTFVTESSGSYAQIGVVMKKNTMIRNRVIALYTQLMAF